MPRLLSIPKASEHIARCARASALSADAFGRAVWLAQASARVRSERFWSNLATLHAQFLGGRRHPIVNGREMRDIFSLKAKWDGVCYNWNNRADLRDAVLSCADPVDALTVLSDRAKWLSTVKGGFVLQLTTAKVGCIDSVNRRLYGLGRNVTASPARYVALCESLGGSAALWAHWCNVVAAERGTDPVALSLAHVTFVETGTCEPVNFNV